MHACWSAHRLISASRQADPNHAGFGSIKVINEDRVDVHKGFDLHPHREFEIFSYIISGELAQ
jgi:redox-sensitive bicupin YhaK (pirin superfamily)